MIELVEQSTLAIDQNTLDFMARQAKIILMQSDEDFIIQTISNNWKEFGIEIGTFDHLPLSNLFDFSFSKYKNKPGPGLNYQLSIPANKLLLPNFQSIEKIEGLLQYSEEGWLVSSLWTLQPHGISNNKPKKENRIADYKQDLFKNLFETAGDAIFVIRGNCFIDCNTKALEMFSCSRKQIIGHSPFEYSPKLQPDGRLSKESAIEKIRASISGKAMKFEWLHCKHDGSPFYTQVSLNTLTVHGEVLIQAIVRDIDEVKKVSLKLEHSNKVKTIFLATMSHELRTPLNAIIGFSSLIESDSENPETRAFGNIINKSGQHLLSIINDMFDISVIESGHLKLYKERFKISEFFDETYQILHADQERTGKFQIELRQQIPHHYYNQYIVTDKSRLGQIFVNLLKNAFKFTEEGSIEFGLQRIDSSSVTFYVSDTGVGIAKEKQGLIFNLFQQVDDVYTRKSNGAGIGLALCKKLVECMGGAISLESEEGKGSTFYVTLKDVIPRFQIKPEPSPVRDNIPDLKGKLILIAEDEESNFRLLKAWIEKTGAHIFWVKDGLGAVDYMAANPLVDLVVMDIKMPNLNGYKATQLIKQIRPDIPIVVQTAYALSGDDEKAQLSGCDSYVPKPVSKKKLYKELRKHLLK